MLSRKNALLTCLLILIFTTILFYQACADTLWVDETWHHLTQTMDCDGIQLVVDADVLDVPALGAAWYLPEERQITTRDQHRFYCAYDVEQCAFAASRRPEHYVYTAFFDIKVYAFQHLYGLFTIFK